MILEALNMSYELTKLCVKILSDKFQFLQSFE